MKPLVVFEDVTKRFGDNVVLDKLSMSFMKGQTHVICGRSGAGKSTLIRCINMLETVDAGRVYFDNYLVNKKNAQTIRKQVGMVFQHFNLFPHLSVLDNITLGPVKALKQPRNIVQARALKYLDQVGLADKKDALPYQLSGGQKQRVAIVRALAMEPVLILFDEPTSALDPEMIGEVLDVMRRLASNNAERTMIVVTHEMGFAKEAADMISFMDSGRIVETKSPAEFFEHPEHDSTRKFLQQILQV